MAASILANGLLNATGLKKNFNLGGGNSVRASDAGIAEVYEYMAKGACSGVGREILVTCGLAEWLLRFDGMLHLKKTSLGYIPQKSDTQEFAEEMIVLFANMLQEVTGSGI